MAKCEECKKEVEWTADGICVDCITSLRARIDDTEELEKIVADGMAHRDVYGWPKAQELTVSALQRFLRGKDG